MIRRATLLIGSLSLLAACGAREPAPAANESNAEAATPPAESQATPPFAEVNGAHPYAPEKAPIPAQFRGIWAESEALCADLAHHNRLVVSGATLRFPTNVVEVAKVEPVGERSIALTAKQPDGGAVPAEFHFSVSADGGTLTDEAGGGMVRRRCAA